MVVAAQRRVTSAVDPDSGARYESAKGRNEDIANHAGYILMLHSNKVRLPVLYGTCRIPGRRPEISPCWAAVAPSFSPARYAVVRPHQAGTPSISGAGRGGAEAD